MSEPPLRLALVTDAWLPQVNGVVELARPRRAPAAGLGRRRSTVVAPDRFRTVPCPTYPEIRLALAGPSAVAARDRGETAPTTSTSPPKGRSACWRAATASQPAAASRPATTRASPNMWRRARRCRCPGATPIMRRFHNAGLGCMVATPSLEAELAARGFRNLMRWSRGVDRELFRPRPGADLGLPRPVFLYVGRVAVEKNVEAFLRLDLPGTKVVVGDGPALHALARAYPQAHFLGVLRGEALANAYAAADVFVFPEPDRHLRQRAPGGARLRRAGRRLSGDRPEGRDHRSARRRARRGLRCRGARGARLAARRRRGNSRCASPGRPAPRRFATTS